MNFKYYNNIECTEVQKKTKHAYLFQHKLSYRNETGTNHHGLVSTLVKCFKMFLWVASTWRVCT